MKVLRNRSTHPKAYLASTKSTSEIVRQSPYNDINQVLDEGREGLDNMTRESKAELEVRQWIVNQLAPNEALREFTWGARNSTSIPYFLFGYLGAELARRDQPGFFIGLTDRRLILLEVKGKVPTGSIHHIPTADIKGISYRRGPYSGTLNIHLSADTLELNFDRKPWYPRAQNMSRLMPFQK